MKKILLAVGTRPEIIKMAPIYHELKNHYAQPVLIHTGQHTTMASSLYELFNIVPDHVINLDQPPSGTKSDSITPGSCSLSLQSSQLLEKISNVLTGMDISAVLVHGDTSSALMSAMAAFYQKRPVAHIEAGLRSHNGYNPFPEEMNRVLIAKLARWHFAPTASTRRNLLDEGIADSHIYVVGNTIVEAAQLGATKLGACRRKYTVDSPDLIERVKPHLAGKKMIVVTAHRRENQASNIHVIAQAVLEVIKKYPDIFVVWPVHPNPVVQQAVFGALKNFSPSIAGRLYLTKPLDYPLLLWALKHAWLLLTDSGGLQEEAVAMHTPVLVLRDTTERPEIIEAGAGKLVGTKKANILLQVEALLHDPDRHRSMCMVENPYGDGLTAKRICSILAKENMEKNQGSHAI